MLIVITTDQDIVHGISQPASNAQSWAPVNFLNPGGNPGATVKLKAMILNVKINEDLCITGHGNDDEIGDENLNGKQSWTWSVDDMANILNDALPKNFYGKIVMEVCSDSANNFASKLAVALGRLGRIGLEIYGYTTGINITKPFPSPNNLVGLQVYVSRANADMEGMWTAPATAENMTAGANQSSPHAGSIGFDTQPPPPPPPPAPNWVVEAKKPISTDEKYNIPASKYYVVNETGNIMVATTSPDSTKIDPDVLAVFQEVAVFFAAMTSAISSTPRNGKVAPYGRRDYYTIYDYEAIEAIVNQSGLFVNVREEDLTYQRQDDTIDVNLELIESLLGVALTDGVGAAGLKASLNAMGKQATFSYNSSGKSDKIANILFLCEYIFGMPIVNVLYFYLDEKVTEDVVTTPCVSADFAKTALTIHKDTFMFVLPDWIRKYAGDLASVSTDPQYRALIAELKGYISQNPVISSITTDQAGTTAVTSFAVSTPYYINGVNFPALKGSISISGTPQTVTSDADWTTTQVKFTFVKPVSGTEGYVDMFAAPVGTAPAQFVIESPVTIKFA